MTVLLNVCGPALLRTPRAWLHAHAGMPHQPEVSVNPAEDRADRMHEVSEVRFAPDDRLDIDCACGRRLAECRLWLPTAERTTPRQTWLTRPWQ
ncbi:hypothetical protein ACL02R_19495 [Streptomyces sp. MS19]|uniref:hypothetical protein n=1 Tax=Streptomyces sp. MS19 TaxID=3385972 RepID=UPI0039A2B23F